MNQEQMGKNTIQWFKGAKHYTCIFNWTCDFNSEIAHLSHPGLAQL